jgi:hypothetical protein
MEDPAMAEEEERTFAPNTVSSNRGQMQGLGAGRREMDAQQAPDRQQQAMDPQRTEPFDQSLDPTTNADRPSEADFSGQEPGDAQGARANAAPPNVSEPELGQEDNPEEDWGEPAPDAVFSSNHTRRPARTEAERGQGAKTRKLNKDIVSRRAT